MSAAQARCVEEPRRILGELDPNKDLDPRRGLYKRDPVVLEQGNEAAVLEGLQLGIYDLDEVIALTNFRVLSPAVTPGDRDISDDEHARFAGGVYERGDMSDEELMEGYEEGDGDHELLGDAMVEELDDEMDDDDDDEHLGSDDERQDHTFNAAALGLKEINNLAHFGVSSHRPGNGVAELLSDDLDKYWQSDGQQPHLLTIHFLRRVEIRAIRFYVDYNQDESYTPTHIVFYAGTGHHDLIQFAEVPLTNPVGWQDVPVADSGGGADGHSLCCWMVQMHIKENHQNGKDTHIRGIKIYALDDQSLTTTTREAASGLRADLDDSRARVLTPQGLAEESFQELLDAFERHPVSLSNLGDSMREPVIR